MFETAERVYNPSALSTETMRGDFCAGVELVGVSDEIIHDSWYFGRSRRQGGLMETAGLSNRLLYPGFRNFRPHRSQNTRSPESGYRKLCHGAFHSD